MNSSPKQRFQESKENVAFWSELTTKATFIRGLDTALLQIQHELPDTDDPITAAARFQRLNGAKRLKALLLDLPEIAKDRASLPDINLKPQK